MRHAAANRQVMTALLVLLGLVRAPAPARAQDRPGGGSAGVGAQGFSPWQSPARFRERLKSESRLDRYPTEIEGRADADDMSQFRAKFVRVPGEKYFRCEEHHGMAAEEYERTRKRHQRSELREIYHSSYLDAVGVNEHCTIWITSFPIMVKDLATSTDDAKRISIVRTLASLGSEDAEVQGVMLRALRRCRSDPVREEVVSSLSRIKVDPTRTVAALIDAWETDRSRSVRLASLVALGNFHDQAAQSVPVLVQAAVSVDRQAHIAALVGLAKLYEQGDLSEHLSKGNVGHNVNVLSWLLAVRNADRAAVANDNDQEQWEEFFDQQPGVEPKRRVFRASEEVRARVIHDLGLQGMASRSALPAVLEALRSDPANRVRRAAAMAVVQLAPDDPDVESALVTAMTKDLPVQLAAAAALSQLRPLAARHVPEITSVLQTSPSTRLRHELLDILAHADSKSPEVENVLVELYQEEADLALRSRAARGLAQLDPELLVDGQRPVEVCLRAAKKQLASTHPIVKAEGIRALGIMGSAAKSTIPDLIDATQHYSYSVQNAALIALSRMGPDAREAVPYMIALLRDENWLLIPPVAATALGNLGAVAKEAVPALNECLSSRHRGLRQAAAIALEKIEGEGRATKFTDASVVED